MADFKTGLSDPNIQFTRVQARQAPDSREAIVEGLAGLAGVAGKAFAKSEGEEITGTASTLSEVNTQADVISESIDKALGAKRESVEGPLSKRTIEETRDVQLSKFSTDDRVLRALRDRGTISTTEARARRQLNLRRALSNPINAMFKKDFLNASGDMTGGGTGAAAALFPYTAEEETAMAIAEEQRKVQAEHEAQVFDIVQTTGQSEEFVRAQLGREELSRQKLANYETIKLDRNLNADEFSDYQANLENSATRGMTLQISNLMTQSGGKGLDAIGSVNATRTLEYQYNGMLERLMTDKGLVGVHRDKAIERLDKWKTGMSTFIGAHSLSTFNTTLVEGLKSNAVMANWEAFPQMMAMATVYPEMAKVYFESAGEIEHRMEGIMGAKNYSVWKTKVGDMHGEMGKFQNGETADPQTIGAFNTPESIEYLSKRAAEDPAVRTNLLKAYNDATEVSLSTYNNQHSAWYAPQSEEFRNQIGMAMDVAKTKVDNIKRLVGVEGAVIFASTGDKSAGDVFFGRKSGVVLDIPDNMMEYQEDIKQMYRTVDRHPWAWLHVEDQYEGSADAFNGYLRGEWDFDPTMGKGDLRGRIAPEIPPTAEELDDPTLIRQGDREELMDLLLAEEEGETVDEERLEILLEQRLAIRDRKRPSSGVKPPGAISIAEAVADAPESKLSAASTARVGEQVTLRDESRQERVRQFENSIKAGFEGGVWRPHTSIEGGTDTLAYGHKLTPSEAKSGFVKVGKENINYKDVGLTEEQAQALFKQDWERAGKDTQKIIKERNLNSLPRVAKGILQEMVYQMGLTGVRGFKNTLTLLEKGEFDKAADGMLDSKWAKKDSPERAKILAEEMRDLDV